MDDFEEFSEDELSDDEIDHGFREVGNEMDQELDAFRARFLRVRPNFINRSALLFARSEGDSVVALRQASEREFEIDEAYNALTLSEVGPSAFDIQDPKLLENFENMDTLCREQMLVKAVFMGNSELIQTLINLGVSVHADAYKRHLFYASKNTMTPLMIAAYYGFLPCLQVLINNGAAVNSTDRYDVTALHLAAQNGHFDCLKALLEASANGNAITKCSKMAIKEAPYYAGTTPLHLAAIYNHTDCVKELMKNGVDYNAIDEKGNTPLYIAAKLGYRECILVLLKNAIGRDILSLPSFDTGDTPLHFAVRHGLVDCVRELLHHGSDVNHQNYAGSSPLHNCLTATCEHKVSFQILKLLVLYGYNTNLNLKDSVGLTPLHYVAFNAASVLTRRPDMAKFLIGYGANIHIYNHRGASIMKCEFNSNDSDISLLEACAQTIFVPPCPKDLRSDNFAIGPEWPNNAAEFYSMWMAVSRGIAPPLHADEYENFQQNLRVLSSVDPKTTEKQAWYAKNVPYGQIPSLQHQCRYVIRQNLGLKRLKFIKYLYIPEPLKSYLVYGTDYTVQ